MDNTFLVCVHGRHILSLCPWNNAFSICVHGQHILSLGSWTKSYQPVFMDNTVSPYARTKGRQSISMDSAFQQHVLVCVHGQKVISMCTIDTK